MQSANFVTKPLSGCTSRALYWAKQKLEYMHESP